MASRHVPGTAQVPGTPNRLLVCDKVVFMQATIFPIGIRKVRSAGRASGSIEITLPPELAGLKIASRSVNPRKGRQGHRLFMAERGVQARSASGATVSVLGFHWWMLLIASILVERGES